MTASWFKWIARAEGVSLLVLFGVAMPLKYGAGMAHATIWPGWFHGQLFILYLIALGSIGRVKGWSIKQYATGFAASLLPGGTFLFERRVLAN